MLCSFVFSRFMASIKKLLLVALLALPLGAVADRLYPPNAEFGYLRGYDFPAVNIDGHILTLATGVRLRDENNLFLLAQDLPTGVRVMILRDASGEIRELWVLSAEEAAALR